MSGIYDGIKVLDLSRLIAGPYCAMMLGDMGADVLKVEKRGVGDGSRTYEPQIAGESVYHFVLNRNKRSLELDFRSSQGRQVLFELAVRADIIIQNFRPGTIEKMGIAPNEVWKVNPRVIYGHISGFGQDGPYKNRPGFDAIAQAMSGIMSLTGEPDRPPMMAGIFILDFTTAMYTTIALEAALFERERSGKGQVVETCLLDSGVSMMLTGIPYQKLYGKTFTRMGNRDKITSPCNVFKTKSGEWVLCIAGPDEIFVRFAKVCGRPELLTDERFSTVKKRLEHADELEGYLGEWIGQYETDELLALAEREGIALGRVESLDKVVENPQLKYRNKIIDVHKDSMGDIPMLSSAFDFSRTPVEVRRPAPALGEHSAEALRDWLGYGSAQIEKLLKEEVI